MAWFVPHSHPLLVSTHPIIHSSLYFPSPTAFPSADRDYFRLYDKVGRPVRFFIQSALRSFAQIGRWSRRKRTIPRIKRSKPTSPLSSSAILSATLPPRSTSGSSKAKTSRSPSRGPVARGIPSTKPRLLTRAVIHVLATTTSAGDPPRMPTSWSKVSAGGVATECQLQL